MPSKIIIPDCTLGEDLGSNEYTQESQINLLRNKRISEGLKKVKTLKGSNIRDSPELSVD
jgi:hypothetical protein